MELKFCMGVQEEGMGVEEEFVIFRILVNKTQEVSKTHNSILKLI